MSPARPKDRPDPPRGRVRLQPATRGVRCFACLRRADWTAVYPLTKRSWCDLHLPPRYRDRAAALQ